VSLVIHGRVARRQRLTCHHCGHDEQIREECSECGSHEIARMGAGTEQIEQRIAETFEVPVFRLDADAVKTRGAVGEILAQFAAAGPSLLVGTQMVAKGHDFPDVELAVVIDADSALAIPDFRAEERAFALDAQLAGRSGRSKQPAEHAREHVQTRYPQASFIEAAREHDVDGFLAHELRERKQHDWPPYKRIVRVVVSGRSEAARDKWLRAVGDGLRRLEAGNVLGPAPLMRINERDRGQVLVVTSSPSQVATAVRNFLGTTDDRRKKEDVRVLLDVDPQALI
jgi:primosomal protein N' (replication factor Y)